MLQSLKTNIVEFIRSLTDLRKVGRMIFVVIVLLTSWSSVKAIQTNFELQKKIAKLEQQVEIKKLENDNLRLANQYLETDQFLELAARRQFGKARSGETMFIVPEQIALSYTTKPQAEKSDKSAAQTNKPKYQQNLEAWTNFFFRKSQNKLLES